LIVKRSRRKKTVAAAAAPAAKRTHRVGLDRAISALELEAAAWAARSESMRTTVATMRDLLRQASQGKPAANGRRGPGRPPTAGGRRARRGQGVGSAAVEILSSWGRAARVNELLAELDKRGVKVGGKRPYATLAATLLKHKGVKRAGRGLFAAAK
jgi:hypothetical protein